jgi:hypothetical protein
LPGNPLYPVKRNLEKIALALIPDSFFEMQLRFKLLDRRANEANAAFIQQATGNQALDEIVAEAKSAQLALTRLNPQTQAQAVNELVNKLNQTNLKLEVVKTTVSQNKPQLTPTCTSTSTPTPIPTTIIKPSPTSIPIPTPYPTPITTPTQTTTISKPEISPTQPPTQSQPTTQSAPTTPSTQSQTQSIEATQAAIETIIEEIQETSPTTEVDDANNQPPGQRRGWEKQGGPRDQRQN